MFIIDAIKTRTSICICFMEILLISWNEKRLDNSLSMLVGGVLVCSATNCHRIL
jgi:hypothetical protein